MKRLLMAAVVVAFGVTGTTACATKGYVKNQVGQVSTKVDTLSQSLEATQERTRQNEAKIAEVDQKAQAGISGAQQAALTADGYFLPAAHCDGPEIFTWSGAPRLVSRHVRTVWRGDPAKGGPDLAVVHAPVRPPLWFSRGVRRDA